MRVSDVSFYLISLGVAFSLNSIAISEILILSGILFAIFFHIKSGRKIFYDYPFLPLLLFLLWSIISASLSKFPLQSFLGLKKMWIFLIPFFLPETFREKRDVKFKFFLYVLSLSLMVASVYGIYQFLICGNPQVSRIKGFSDHPMTYSGTLSLSLIFLFVYLMESRKKNWLLTLSVILGFFAISLSLTRSYWISFFPAVFIYFFLKKRYKSLFLFLFAIFLILFSSHSVRSRVSHLFDTKDPGNHARLEMWSAGFRIVKKYPVFGISPEMVKKFGYSFLEKKDFPRGYFMHLHNDYLQIAAERGLPALFFFIWFLFSISHFFLKLFKKYRRENELSFVSLSSLFVVFVLVVSGFFEYNFWDSEVLILFIFLISLPFAFYNKGKGEKKYEET